MAKQADDVDYFLWYSIGANDLSQTDLKVFLQSMKLVQKLFYDVH